SFQHELSVIGVRDQAGREVFYPPIENLHREGVLRRSIAPAPGVTPETAAIAIDYSRRLMDRLQYVGVLALELFSVNGALLANEMAPRVVFEKRSSPRQGEGAAGKHLGTLENRGGGEEPVRESSAGDSFTPAGS